MLSVPLTSSASREGLEVRDTDQRRDVMDRLALTDNGRGGQDRTVTKGSFNSAGSTPAASPRTACWSMPPKSEYRSDPSDNSAAIIDRYGRDIDPER